ncbi:MAG: GFA family protein [Solirubrobacteraceae bacterium]
MSSGGVEVSLPITGGCNCGAVRFEVSEPFEASMYCHCTRCQRRTGTAASANARTRPDAFRIVQGEDRLRSWDPPDGAPKLFCGDCGSALFSRSPGSVGIRLGTIDGDPGIRPTYRQYVAYAAAWEPIPDDGLPRHPEARPAS